MKREFYYDYNDNRYYPMELTLCYHTKNPHIYNPNTKYEKRVSDFLLYVVGCEVGQEEKVIKEVENINANHLTKFGNLPIEWEKYDIEYLYVDQQEPFQ